MVVPTLPVIGVAPPFEVFRTMKVLAIALVHMLLTVAFVSTLVLLKPLLIPILYCIKPSTRRRTPKQRGLGSCRKSMNSVFLFVGRWLCVQTFPALFKMHKTHSGRGRQTREFMVFLDRKVESSVKLIAAFCSIACCIFFISAAVLFLYFPVEASAECLEKDNHGRTLFCYSDSSLINSSLPVDCANYSMTEVREIKFHCYAIALPVGLGIAVAAALGLAKVGIMGVTILVKVTEGFFTMTKNPTKLPHCCCCCCRLPYANKVYVYSSSVLLVIVFLISLSCSIIIVRNIFKTDRKNPQHILRFLHYYAYIFLPLLICAPLIYIVQFLEAHCSRGEYISFAADQSPLDPRDWDVESGTSIKTRRHYIASSMQTESGDVSEVRDEKEETLLVEVSDNIEFTEDGAT